MFLGRNYEKKIAGFFPLLRGDRCVNQNKIVCASVVPLMSSPKVRSYHIIIPRSKTHRNARCVKDIRMTTSDDLAFVEYECRLCKTMIGWVLRTSQIETRPMITLSKVHVLSRLVNDCNGFEGSLNLTTTESWRSFCARKHPNVLYRSHLFSKLSK